MTRLGMLPDNSLVASPQISIYERFPSCLLIVEIAQRYSRALDPEFSRRIILGHLFAFRSDNTRLNSRQQTSRRSKINIARNGRAYYRRTLSHSIPLSDGPSREHGLQIFCRLLTQGRCTSKDAIDRRKIVLLYHISRFGNRDDDWRDQIQIADLVCLDGFQEALELEFGQDDDSVAAVRTQMCNNNQSIDVVKRKLNPGSAWLL